MKLTRTDFTKYGVFGLLISEDQSDVYCTLEHAYPQTDGTFLSKIPNGQYICKRGIHRLEGMTSDFETFEIQGIPYHSNILFHVGNINSDSSGCVLLALSRIETEILHSKDAFVKFMDSLVGINSFTLTVDNQGDT